MMPLRVALVVLALLAGCRTTIPKAVYLSDPPPADEHGTSPCDDLRQQIEYPAVVRCGFTEGAQSVAPRTMADGIPTDFWDLSFEEAIRIGLQNSTILRDLGGRVLDSPESVATVFDPAIAMSNPRTGEVAALSAFDAQINESFAYGDSNRIFNNAAQGGGAFIVKGDNFRWDWQLTKVAATGTQFGLRTFTAYEHNNAPANLFTHAWRNSAEAIVRQPLLQGAGTRFNRIAGPGARATGVNLPGVLLARINGDISLADFERSVRDYVYQVEAAYWDLYLAYRILAANQVARDGARETWQITRARFDQDLQGGEADREAQAREQLLLFEQQVLLALDGTAAGGARPGVYSLERQLRRLLGLADDGEQLIRPSDEPLDAPIRFDWDDCRLDALIRRVELRKQMWRVKQRELELTAARNFLLPRLDFLASYRVEGLGDDLIAGGGNFQGSLNELGSFEFYDAQAALQLNVPIGYRREMAGVRHAELNLARERAVLKEQENLIVLRLSDAMAAVATTYKALELAYPRLVAAENVVKSRTATYDTGGITVEFFLLEAQRRYADARIEYHRARINHMLALREVHLQKGTLLAYNGIQLVEGPSCDAACLDARERLAHFEANRLDYRLSQPGPVSQGPYDPTIEPSAANDPFPPIEPLPLPPVEAASPESLPPVDAPPESPRGELPTPDLMELPTPALTVMPRQGSDRGADR